MMKINLYLMLAVGIFTSLRADDWRYEPAEQERRLKECGRREWLSWDEQVKRWQEAGNTGTPADCNQLYFNHTQNQPDKAFYDLSG